MIHEIISDIFDEDPSSTTNADSEAETPAEIQQDSTLLKLPLEVFQTVTWHMDVGTFFASLLTCQHFLAAAQSKPTLFRHMNNIPGLRLGLDDLSNADLLLRFRKRAAESGCAAGVLSDVTRFSSASQTPVSHAVFSPAIPSEPRSTAQLVTVHGGSIIQIYDLGKDHVRHKTELHIEPAVDEDGCRMKIVKMAIASGSRDLAVLYQSWFGVRDACVGPHEPGMSNNHIYKLVTFHRVSAKLKGYFYSSTQQERRDINNFEQGEEPVGLALASNGNACIAWKHPSRQSETKVWLVGRDAKLMEACAYGQ